MALGLAGACGDDIEIKREPQGCFRVCKNGSISFKFNHPLASNTDGGNERDAATLANRGCSDNYPCVCRVPGAIVASTHNRFDHPLYEKCAATFHHYNPLPFASSKVRDHEQKQ